MKSAYELAMERLGGARTYTDEQKRKLAEIDKVCDAKRAEAQIRADEALKKLGDDPEGKQEETLRADLARDLAKIEEKRESEKERVRKAAKA